MNAYCDRQSVEMNSIAFLFDGRRLQGAQTPDEVFIRDLPLWKNINFVFHFVGL